MVKLFDLYNHSPHSTLSYYFERPVTPDEVEHSENLQRLLAGLISDENEKIIEDNEEAFEVGDLVYIFNPAQEGYKRRTMILTQIVNGKRVPVVRQVRQIQTRIINLPNGESRVGQS
jgi:hypothetical protein